MKSINSAIYYRLDLEPMYPSVLEKKTLVLNWIQRFIQIIVVSAGIKHN